MAIVRKKSLPRPNAKQIGNQAEQILAEYHNVARNRGVVDLRFLPTPTARVRGCLIYSQKSLVDYVGFLLDGTGRFVALECKGWTSEKPFRLAEVKVHQRLYLDQVLQAGGIAVLTVVCKGRYVFVCPWQEVRERKTMAFEDFKPYHVTILTYGLRFLAPESTVR